MCIEVALANALMGVGTAVSAVSSYQQGKAQAAAYNAQAAADDQNAKIAAKQAEQAAASGASEERATRQRGAAVAGAQRAAYSASGLDIGAGSPLDVLGDTMYQTELDALNVRRDSANTVWGYQVQEGNYKNSASANRSAASNAKRAGKLGAVSNLLTGATGMAKYNTGLNG